MSTLHELQSDFRRCLLGEAPEQLLRLVDGIGFAPQERLSIYRNNMFVTLTDVLKTDFPVVCRLVGERFFEFAATMFVRQHPPAHPCLAEYGDDFPGFLANFPAAASLVYLPDVARLEWAINRVLRAPYPEPSIPLESLVSIPGDPASIRLAPAAASAHISSPHPIDRIWQINQPDVTPTETAHEPSGACLEIGRAGGLRITSLPRAEWAFRSRIADGATLGIAAEEAMAIAPDFDLARALAALFDANLVVGIL